MAGQLTRTRGVAPGEQLPPGWHVDALWELSHFKRAELWTHMQVMGRNLRLGLCRCAMAAMWASFVSCLGLADEQTCGVHAQGEFDARWACQNGSFLLFRGCCF